MGVTIHYKGRISDKAKLPLLVDEIEEIARVHEWDYRVYNRDFSLDSESEDALYGISLHPENCEPVNLTFLANGRMCGAANLAFWGKETESPYREYLYLNSTKTQFAGAEVHRLLVGIFRYISHHYLEDFEFLDEGQFWETNDYDLLKKKLGFIDDMLDSLSLAFSTIPSEKGESTYDYIARIAQRVRKHSNK